MISIKALIGLLFLLLTSLASDNPEKTDDCGCSKASREAVHAGNAIESSNFLLENLTSADQLETPMVLIPGGKFYMGTANPILMTDGEGPRRPVTVSTFYMDKFEVSNLQFQAFVNETGYRTDSEQYGWSFVFESALSQSVKEKISQAVLGAEWWLPVNGASWLEPEGPGSDVFKSSNWRGNYPATHISWNDAFSFCRWRNSRLPTEAEWERAAQGSVNSNTAQMFPWGNKLTPKGIHRANIFQGNFPTNNTVDDGFEFMSPVDAFPPQNDFGVHNMIGNVWEWVQDWWTIDHDVTPQHNPTGPLTGLEKVKKGGSFLCHRSYCYRYRSVARYRTTPDSATLNSGFRCAKDSLDKSSLNKNVEDSLGEEL